VVALEPVIELEREETGWWKYVLEPTEAMIIGKEKN
jgi:hypothetical protein